MSASKRLRQLKDQIEEISVQSIGRRNKLVIGKLKGSGHVVAVIYRRCDQIYRGQFTTLNEANRAGVLSWMIDAPVIPHLREFYGVKFIIVVERESGDLWVSRIESWEDDDLLLKNEHGLYITDKRGFSLRHLPVKHMVHKPCKTDLLALRQRAK